MVSHRLIVPRGPQSWRPDTQSPEVQQPEPQQEALQPEPQQPEPRQEEAKQEEPPRKPRQWPRRLRYVSYYTLTGLGLLVVVLGFASAMPVGAPHWALWLMTIIRHADAGIVVTTIGLVAMMIGGALTIKHSLERSFRRVPAPVQPMGPKPWDLAPASQTKPSGQTPVPGQTPK